MDELKRQILTLVDLGRVRFSRHFWHRVQQRDTDYSDAERVLRNGALDPARCEGDNLAFVGADTRQRRSLVIVRLDLGREQVVFLSIRPMTRGER